MLRLFKAGIKVSGNTIVIKGMKELVSPGKVYIPGDISSAAFFLILASILPNSQLLIRNVSLNPSRMGIIKILERMGADINIKYQISTLHLRSGLMVSGVEPSTLRLRSGLMMSGVEPSTLRLRSGLMMSGVEPSNIKYGEPMGDIIVKSSSLKGIVVKKEDIPSLIDELPILMVAACFAKGNTLLEGVNELRVKETDRIRSMTVNLKKMKAEIQVKKVGTCENIIIKGTKDLEGARVRSFGDHRTAMSMVIAGLAGAGTTQLDNISCISKSFPGFIRILNSIIK
jgi:3-phosphoshikimate 1-carboxyvinyltransferase